MYIKLLINSKDYPYEIDNKLLPHEKTQLIEDIIRDMLLTINKELIKSDTNFKTFMLKEAAQQFSHLDN